MKKSKIIWIVSAVCALFLVAIILVIAFFDCWVGYSNLKKVRKGIPNSTEIAISSPLYFDRYSSVAETVITGDEVKELSKMLIAATDDVSYEGMINASLGYWDTRLTFYCGEDRYVVYIKDEELYVTGKNGYLFEPEGVSEDVYESFYMKIRKILDSVE